MISLANRAQDWLAQRTRVVPFSPSRVIERQKPPLFKTEMPWYLRGFLVLVGVVLIGIAVAVLALLALFFWAVIKA